MNGRIYDPLLGRMLSADTMVQFPGSLQSYNRYSYVENNPLTMVDPTGWYSVLGLEFTDGGGVGGFFKDLGGYGGDVVMGAVGDNMVAGYKAGTAHMEVAGAEWNAASSSSAPGLTRTIAVLHGVASVGDAVGVVLNVTPAGKAEGAVVQGAEKLAVKAETAVSQAVEKAEGKAATLESRVEGVATGADSTVSKAAPASEAKAAEKTSWTSTDRRNAWKEKGTNGKPPERDVVVKNKKTGEQSLKTEKKELHHEKPRRDGGGNEDSNLKEKWPTEHAEVDPHRKVNYEVIEVIEERDPRKKQP